MATSGTATYSPTIAEIVEEAYERAGLQLRNGYDLRTARRSLNFLAAEWANRGLNLWSVTERSVAMTTGTTSYTLGTDVIDVIEAVTRENSGSVANQSDIILGRIGVSQYASIPNKLDQGKPVQFYVDRQQAAPVLYLWPTHDGTVTRTLNYWCLRRTQDFSNGPDTADVPFRFYPALVAGLAFHLAMKNPQAASRAPSLKEYYEQMFDLAAGEDRERSSFVFVPGGYS